MKPKLKKHFKAQNKDFLETLSLNPKLHFLIKKIECNTTGGEGVTDNTIGGEPFHNTNQPQASVSSARTIPIGRGMSEVAAAPTQMNFSRSSSYIQIPKFGMA